MRSDPPEIPRQRFSLTESEVGTLHAALDSYMTTIIANGMAALESGRENLTKIALIKHQLKWRHGNGN